MPDLGAPELIIIAVVVLVLFGSKKLPEAARSLGRSLRIFKSEVKAMGDDADTPATPTPATPAGLAGTPALAPALTASNAAASSAPASPTPAQAVTAPAAEVTTVRPAS